MITRGVEISRQMSVFFFKLFLWIWPSWIIVWTHRIDAAIQLKGNDCCQPPALRIKMPGPGLKRRGFEVLLRTI